MVDALVEEEIGPTVRGSDDVKRSRRYGSYGYHHHKYAKRYANHKADSPAKQ